MMWAVEFSFVCLELMYLQLAVCAFMCCLVCAPFSLCSFSLDKSCHHVFIGFCVLFHVVLCSRVPGLMYSVSSMFCVTWCCFRVCKVSCVQCLADFASCGVVFARVVFVKKIARDHKIYITVLMNKRRGVLVLLFGDFDIPSGSHRIRVFFVYRTTLLQMRFLWNPNLREQTERRAVL